MNFPTKFGFEADLRKCIGKTIEAIELMQMEYGCTWPQAFAVRFTDGSRAFFGAAVGTGIMNPRIDGESYGQAHTVGTSGIFTIHEHAEMVEARAREAERRQRRREEDERREFERLAAKFSATAT